MSGPWAQEHVALDLRLDPSGEWPLVAGRATLTVRRRPGQSGALCLDAVALDIEEVRVDGVTTAAVDHDGAVLSVELDGERRRAEVSVAYRAWPRTDLHVAKPTTAEPGRVVQAHVSNERAGTWFPCLDHTDERSTSEVALTVPPGWRVLSNGALVGESDAADGWVRWHWRLDRRHPTTGISFVAGPMTVHVLGDDPVPMRVWVPADLDGGAACRLLAHTPDYLRHLGKLTGVDYPYASYDQVLVHDMVGGRENSTTTALMAHALDEDIMLLAGVDVDEVAAHEGAHHWFADHIGLRDPSEVFLAEGFATYLAACWVRHRDGEDAFLDCLDRSLAVWQGDEAANGRRPLVTRFTGEARNHVSRTTYEKGARVLHHLAHVVGDDGFWAGVGEFAHRWGDGSARVADFISCVEDVTGRSLLGFAEQWLHRAGHPELVIHAPADGPMTVRQEQAEGRWEAPLDVVVDGRVVRTALDAEHTTVLTGCQPERWAFVDPECRLPGTLRWVRSRPREWLEAQLREARWSRVRADAADALGDGSGAGDPAANVRCAAVGGPGVPAGLARGLLASDPDASVRAAAAVALGGRLWGRLGPQAVATSVVPDPGVARAVEAEPLSAEERKEVDAALRRSLGADPALRVRAAAARALGEGLDDERPAVRAEALAGLALRDPALAASRLLDAVAPVQPAAVRFGAVRLLPGCEDQSVVAACVADVLAEGWWLLRMMALGVAAARPDPSLVAPLEAVIAEADPRLAPLAELALAACRG